MFESDRFAIRQAYKDEWEEAMRLAWRTFLKFEADTYSKEGIENFREFITSNTVYTMFVQGSYELFVAMYDGSIIGILALRNENHISLLFVDEKYHKNGVASALINHVEEYVRTEAGLGSLTVFAAPYAYGFYHKTGFSDLGEEQHKDGIIYTPMELRF